MKLKTLILLPTLLLGWCFNAVAQVSSLPLKESTRHIRLDQEEDAFADALLRRTNNASWSRVGQHPSNDCYANSSERYLVPPVAQEYSLYLRRLPPSYSLSDWRSTDIKKPTFFKVFLDSATTAERRQALFGTAGLKFLVEDDASGRGFQWSRVYFEGYQRHEEAGAGSSNFAEYGLTWKELPVTELDGRPVHGVTFIIYSVRDEVPVAVWSPLLYQQWNGISWLEARVCYTSANAINPNRLDGAAYLRNFISNALFQRD